MAAKTKKDVEQQSAKDRLWDSLDYSYGKQREQSDEAYDKAIAQTDRQALSRGMQRSSYNNATLANLQNQKVKAQNDITSSQIADYQSRLTALEQQEKEDERWERQFAEGQRQFNEGQAFTAEQNALNRAFQTSERIGSQEYQSGENALNRAFNTSEREAQQAYNTSERIAQQQYQAGENALNRAFSTSEREAQQAYQSGENALAREFQAQQNAAQQAWQSGENALNRQQSQNQFNTQFGYQQSRDTIEDAFRQQQFDAAQRQWDAEFGANTKTDEQKIAMSYISNILANGGDPSDALLQQAGLSRDDYNAMKQKLSGGGRPTNNNNEETGNEEKKGTFSDFVNSVLSGITANPSIVSTGGVFKGLFGSNYETDKDKNK